MQFKMKEKTKVIEARVQSAVNANEQIMGDEITKCAKSNKEDRERRKEKGDR